MSVRMWRSWPSAKTLAPADRVAVVRTVGRGEPIGDPRLAAAVIDYSTVIKRQQERESDLFWVLPLFAVATLAFAVARTAQGDASSAVVWWVLVAFWATMLVRQPRQRKRALSNAAKAEDAAKQLLAK